MALDTQRLDTWLQSPRRAGRIPKPWIVCMKPGVVSVRAVISTQEDLGELIDALEISRLLFNKPRGLSVAEAPVEQGVTPIPAPTERGVKS